MKITEQHTLIPFHVYEETIDILKEKRKANFSLHSDGHFGGIFDRAKFRYLQEYARWRTGRGGVVSIVGALIERELVKKFIAPFRNRTMWYREYAKRPTVYLQHDADREPNKTLEIMKFEESVEIRSNNYFFYETSYYGDEYELDIQEMKRLQNIGFGIGYHLNAYELAGYNFDKALEFVRRDVSWFIQNFGVKTYVPHGGKPAQDGRNNVDFPKIDALNQLIWAYNGKGLLYDMVWSDGGLSKGATPEDPRIFAQRIPDNCRVNFLAHPQYYGNYLPDTDWERLPIARCRWWRFAWGLPGG